MTVKELRVLLEKYPDDMNVITLSGHSDDDLTLFEHVTDVGVTILYRGNAQMNCGPYKGDIFIHRKDKSVAGPFVISDPIPTKLLMVI